MDESSSHTRTCQSLTTEKIKSVYQLMTDAYIFNGSYVDSSHAPVEIKWSTSQYSPQDVVDMDPQCLPTILCVESGFFGGGNIDCVDAGQVAVVQGIYKQRRVLAIPKRQDDRHFSLPLFGYRHLFLRTGETSSLHDGSADVAASSLDAVLKCSRLPITVKFANDALHEHYGELTLVKQYDELYLYGHNMADGNICLPMTVIPVYLDIVFSIGEGVAGGNASDWRLFKDTYIQESQRLLKDVVIRGYLDMASFDLSWQKRDTSEKQKQSKYLSNNAQEDYQDVDSDSSTDSDEDRHYTYVQPSRYIKMGVDLSSDDSGESPNDEEVLQIEGTDGILARMLTVSSEFMNSAVKGSRVNECSTTSSRPRDAQPTCDDGPKNVASDVAPISRIAKPLPPLPPPKPVVTASPTSAASWSKVSTTSEEGDCGDTDSVRYAEIPKPFDANDDGAPPPLPARRINTVKSGKSSPSYAQRKRDLTSSSEQSLNQLNRSLATMATTGNRGKESAHMVDASSKVLTLASDPVLTKNRLKSEMPSTAFSQRPALHQETSRYVAEPSTVKPSTNLHSTLVSSGVHSSTSVLSIHDQQGSKNDSDDDDDTDEGYVKVDDVEMVANMHHKRPLPFGTSAAGIPPVGSAASRTPGDSFVSGRKWDTIREGGGTHQAVTGVPLSVSGTDDWDSSVTCEKSILSRPLPCTPKVPLTRSYSTAEQSSGLTTIYSHSSQRSSRSLSENDSSGGGGCSVNQLTISDRHRVSSSSSCTDSSPFDSGGSMVAADRTVSSPAASSANGASFATLSDIPVGDASTFSNEQLCQCLRLLGMERCARAFEEDGMIDGQFLMELAVPDLCSHFGFTEFEAKKIILFARGWRPRKR